MGIVGVTLAGARASGATLGAYIYGIDDNSDIYEINPADQTWEKVYSSAAIGTIANSVAYDDSSGQLFFISSDNSTLYGQRYIDGTWHTIDTATGGATPIAGFVTTFGSGNGFRDLGGSALNPVPEPSTLGLAAIGGIASLGYVVRRRWRQGC